MREDLLQYVWRFQRFQQRGLKVHDGRSLRILYNGCWNRDGGPDFLEAEIIVGEVRLYGHVEVHVKSSDWFRHGHDQNPAYDNVVLHVVWENDCPVLVAGQPLTTLVLAESLDEGVLVKYEGCMKSQDSIPCSMYLDDLSFSRWSEMLEKALLKRMEGKFQRVYALFVKNNSDSEMTAYQLLAHSFGFKLNSDSFLMLSERVPWSVVQKKKNDLFGLEALFFGQAGFLDKEAKDEYMKDLMACYAYLKHKYRLCAPLRKSDWQFFRGRPSNFPSVRIAQFVRLLHKKDSLFYLLINSSYERLKEVLNVVPSTYWHQHYLFGKKSSSNVPGLGKKSVDSLIINTVVPLLVTYGKLRDEEIFLERAFSLLRGMPPEENYVTKKWKRLGFSPRHAFDSQGVLGLFTEFCQKKKCCACLIGRHLLGKKGDMP